MLIFHEIFVRRSYGEKIKLKKNQNLDSTRMYRKVFGETGRQMAYFQLNILF